MAPTGRTTRIVERTRRGTGRVLIAAGTALVGRETADCAPIAPDGQRTRTTGGRRCTGRPRGPTDRVRIARSASGVGRGAQDGGDPIEELGGRERLLEELQVRLAHPLGAERVGRVAGHQQDRQPGTVPADLPGDLDPVRAGHDDIGDQEVDRHVEVGEGIERGSAVGEGEDPMAAPDEQPLDERPDSRLILDDGDQGRSDGERRIAAGDPPDRSVPRLRRAERA